MKIELKNLKINIAFSQETTMFMADVVADGVKVAHAKNDGCGGSTYYYACEGKKELLKKVEDFCKSLPPINCGTFSIDSNLENVIDELVDVKVNEKENEKFKKKLAKAMVKNIVWGKPNGTQYKQWGFSGKHTIEELLAIPQ